MKPKEAFKSFFTNVFSNKSAITSRAASYYAGSNLADRLRHAGIDSQGAIPINNDSGNMIALDGERGINVYKGEKLKDRKHARIKASEGVYVRILYEKAPQNAGANGGTDNTR
jgi:hypothetical protein